MQQKRPKTAGNAARQATELNYLLLHLGMSQKEAANHMGLSERTVSRMVSKQGLKDRMRQAKARRTANSVKYDESLTAFIAKMRIEGKLRTPIILEDEYKNFLNTL